MNEYREVNTKKQKFQIGDRVQHKKNLRLGRVSGEKHTSVVEIVEGKERSSERWTYEIEGEGFQPGRWVGEKALISIQPCPNCKEVGWDWISGCGKCGLSPEDVPGGGGDINITTSAGQQLLGQMLSNTPHRRKFI